MGFGLGLRLQGSTAVGGGVGSALSPATTTWEDAYSGTASTGEANGTPVTGLPYGLTGDVTGGVLTITGTPQ